jgi:hypothetical protein
MSKYGFFSKLKIDVCCFTLWKFVEACFFFIFNLKDMGDFQKNEDCVT